MTWSDPHSMFWGGGLEEVVQHEDEGLARLYEQFKGADPLTDQYLLGVNILLEEIQAAETVSFDLKWYTAISTAQGEQLDRIGFDLKQPRLGLSDEPYRCVLLVRIRALFSSGTATDLLEVTNRLVKDERRVRLVEVFPARVCILVEDLKPDEIGLFATVLGSVPAAGVGAHLQSYNTATVLSFADVDATPGVDSTGWYSDVDGTAGIVGAGWSDVAEI